MHPKRHIRCVGRATRKQGALNDASTQCYKRLVDEGVVATIQTVDKVLLVYVCFLCETLNAF
jgi:hypothetical protein